MKNSNATGKTVFTKQISHRLNWQVITYGPTTDTTFRVESVQFSSVQFSSVRVFWMDLSLFSSGDASHSRVILGLGRF